MRDRLRRFARESPGLFWELRDQRIKVSERQEKDAQWVQARSKFTFNSYVFWTIPSVRKEYFPSSFLGSLQ